MNIDLATLSDGQIMLVSDQPLRGTVKEVEYYTSQRLLMLIYDNPMHDSELMHYELPKDIAGKVENASKILVYSLNPDREPTGYEVPLTIINREAISA